MDENLPSEVKPMAYSLAPRTFTEAIKFAEMLSNSSFVPKEFRGKPHEILAAVQFGQELGVGPMQALQNIAVINGKPSVYGDLALALVQSSGLLESIEETDDGKTATCTVKRQGMPVHTQTFSNEDAKAAGLLGKPGPWTQYAARMRKFRARGFALRDQFADVLKGLITREEAMDYPAEAQTYETAKAVAIVKDAPVPIPSISADQYSVLVESVIGARGTDGKNWMGMRMRELLGIAQDAKLTRSMITPVVYKTLMEEIAEFAVTATFEGAERVEE